MKGFLALTGPRVFAHRGLAAATESNTAAPENTLLAFAAAVGIGVSYIETDVHASSDGVAIISHDASLERVAGLPGMVRDLSARQLESIDLGCGAGFPTLAEALDTFPDTRFNIDLKSEDAVQPAVEAIVAAGAIDRVLVSSFNDRRRRRAVRQLSGVATSPGASRFAAAFAGGRLALVPLQRVALRHVDAVQVPMNYGRLQITTPPMIRRLHECRVEVHVWTINNAQTMHELLDLGIDGIITDRADIALRVLAERAS